MKKLTLFDKTLIALALGVVVFFGYFLFRKSTYVTATIKVGSDNIRYEPWQMDLGVRPWFALLFREGMKEQDGLNKVMAEVLKIRSYDTGPEKKAVYLTVKLNAVYNRSSGQYTFKGSPLSVGSLIKLNLNNLFVEGLITQVEGQPDPREYKTILVDAQVINDNPTYANVSGVRPFIANAVSVGDKILDNQNNVIVEVLEKKVTPATRLSTLNGGTRLEPDPFFKDVHLKLKLTVTKVAGHYFILDDIPVTIGEDIPLVFDKISLEPQIVSITESAE